MEYREHEFAVRHEHRDLRRSDGSKIAGRFLGLTISPNKCDRTAEQFKASEHRANPMGMLHAGVLRDLADAALRVAYYTFATDQSFTGWSRADLGEINHEFTKKVTEQ